MESLAFLQDLAVVMMVAGIVTLLFMRLKQPVVLGYLLAGFIIGPYTPPFPLIHDETSIRTMASLGIIFLMFSMGLEFNLRKLRSVGIPALIVAVVEIGCMIWAGYTVGSFFGWSQGDRLLLGIMLALTSTMIVVKGLRDRGELSEKHGFLITGVSLFDDIFVIFVMVLLPGFARTGSLPTGELVLTLFGLFIFLIAAVVVGLLVVPRLLHFVAKFRSDEMLLILVLGLCFGVSLLAVKLKYSAALGAFLMGAIVAESRESNKVITLTAPLRDMFCAVFFVAIGMMIQPEHLTQYAVPVLIVTSVYLVAKIGACAIGSFLAGYEPKVAMRVGTGMAQIGEFAFILATLGRDLGISGEQLYPIIVASASLNAIVRPYLVENADRLTALGGRMMPHPFRSVMAMYTDWVSRLRISGARSGSFRHVRVVAIQLVLNLALVAGIFIAAAFLAQNLPERFVVVPDQIGGAKTICWALAIFASMPLIIASARKGQALAMMLAELAVTDAAAGTRAVHIRTIIAQVMYLAGLVGLVFYIAMLSSAVLPPWPVLAVLLLFLVATVSLLGHMFNRWYSRAKFALVEVWNQPPDPPAEERRPMPPLLRDAELDTFTVPAGPTAGKFIRELQLRTRTGASIVAVERAGRNMVNPSPDEDLQAGDTVLLLGDTSQIAMAKKFMTEGPPADSALL